MPVTHPWREPSLWTSGSHQDTAGSFGSLVVQGKEDGFWRRAHGAGDRNYELYPSPPVTLGNASGRPYLAPHEASAPVGSQAPSSNPAFSPATWRDVLGTSSRDFPLSHSGETEDSSDWECDSDVDGGSDPDADEGCSIHCSFAPWRQHWSVAWRLLPAIFTHDATDLREVIKDLAHDLRRIDCECRDVTTGIASEMATLKALLDDVVRVNDDKLTKRFYKRFAHLNDGVHAAAGGFGMNSTTIWTLMDWGSSS